MSNPEITNVDLGAVELEGGRFNHDKTLTVAATTTIKAGTILAFSTATSKFVPFVVGGADGTGEPKAVITYEVKNETGSPVDNVASLLVEGRVRLEKLVIQADGDASNVDQAVIDQLRDYGITPQSVQETSVLDNQ